MIRENHFRMPSTLCLRLHEVPRTRRDESRLKQAGRIVRSTAMDCKYTLNTFVIRHCFIMIGAVAGNEICRLDKAVARNDNNGGRASSRAAATE